MTTFYIGEQPSDPLVITVRDEDGEPVDLTDVSAVSLVGDTLPAGDCVINNAAEGKVQYTFNEPFEVAGSLVEQVRMVDTAGGVDFSAPFTLTVADLAESSGLLLTTTQVEAMTGSSVSENDIARAQGVICLAVGANLADEDWLDTLSDADLFWLQSAVAHQAVETASVTAGQALVGFSNAVSVQNGDVRVTFKGGSDSTIPELGSLARAALMRLSWLRPMRSMQAKPFLLTPPLPPDPWVTTTTMRRV